MPAVCVVEERLQIVKGVISVSGTESILASTRPSFLPCRGCFAACIENPHLNSPLKMMENDEKFFFQPIIQRQKAQVNIATL